MPSLSEIINDKKNAALLLAGQLEAKKCMSEKKLGRVFNGFTSLVDDNTYAAFTARFTDLAKVIVAKQLDLQSKGKLSRDDPQEAEQIIRKALKKDFEETKAFIDKEILEYAMMELIDPHTGKIKARILDKVFSDFTNEEKREIEEHPAEVVNSLFETIYNTLPVTFLNKYVEECGGKEFAGLSDLIATERDKLKAQGLSGLNLDKALGTACGISRYKKYKDIQIQAIFLIEPLLNIPRILGLGPQDKIEAYLDVRIRNYRLKEEMLMTKLSKILLEKMDKMDGKIAKLSGQNSKENGELDILQAQKDKKSYVQAASASVDQYKIGAINIRELYFLLESQREQIKSVPKTGAGSKFFNKVGIDKSSGTTKILSEILKEIEKVYPELKSPLASVLSNTIQVPEVEPTTNAQKPAPH